MSISAIISHCILLCFAIFGLAKEGKLSSPRSSLCSDGCYAIRRFYRYAPAFIALAAWFGASGQMEELHLTQSDPERVITSASYLADPENTWTIEKMLANEASADFAPYDPENPGYTEDVKTYWLRFSARNTDSLDRGWVFHFDGWSKISMHSVDSGEVLRTQQTGHLVPIPQRDYIAANKPLILDHIKAGERKSYYVHLQSRPDHVIRPTNLGFKVYLRSHFDQNAARDKLVISVFIGIYLLMFLYNLFIYTSTRDKAYLFYLMHIVGLSYMTLNNAGYSVSVFGGMFDSFPMWRGTVESIISAYNTIVAILFTMTFLNTKQYLPFWHKILRVTPFIIMVMLIGVNIHFDAFAPFIYLLMIFILITFVIVGIRSVRKKVPSAQYYLLAYIFAISGTAVLALTLLGVIPMSEFIYHYSSPTGYILQMLFFSFALANKINILKKSNEESQKQIIEHLKENEKLQLQVTEELEAKVEQRTREVVKQKEVIEQEKEKSENLLYNILPQAIAKELISTGTTNPARYDDVSILFTDFVDFTHVSASIPPAKLVSELNTIFYQFDDIMQECGLEKIKTIGDSYMAVAGLPIPCEDHAVRCVRAALAMFEKLTERNKDSSIKWAMRAGIHSGPVIAGVVGKRKFTFDLWGDTVNLASRMESAGLPGKVNVSAYTYDLVRDEVPCSYRGKVNIKGKGEIDVYFVDIET